MGNYQKRDTVIEFKIATGEKITTKNEQPISHMRKEGISGTPSERTIS